MENYYLARLTADDYEGFNSAYYKLVYSIYDKKLELYEIEEKLMVMAWKNGIRSKNDYIKDIENPSREMYFFKTGSKTIGFVELAYHKGKCDIVEFFVFERYQGYGSIMWKQTLKKIEERKPSRIELYSPYEGSQIFWRKMGFSPFYMGDIKCYRMLL